MFCFPLQICTYTQTDTYILSKYVSENGCKFCRKYYWEYGVFSLEQTARRKHGNSVSPKRVFVCLRDLVKNSALRKVVVQDTVNDLYVGDWYKSFRNIQLVFKIFKSKVSEETSRDLVAHHPPSSRFNLQCKVH